MSLLKLAQARRLRIDPGFLVILALPWLLLAAGANWLFSYFGGREFIDPWIYLGFFLDLRTHLKIYPATYYGSRLSWILPGYAAYKLFPPTIAANVLHIGLYYTVIFSLYLTLKETVGRRAALLSAVSMGCYGYFLWAVRWDYVDGVGIAYFLLTTLMLTYAGDRQRQQGWVILSGIFYGAMIYAQLFLVVFTPALFFYYFGTHYQCRPRSLKSICLFLAFGTFGFISVTILLGVINHAFGGIYLFFMPSVRAAIALAPNAFRRPLQSWLNDATWLILPSLVTFSSMAFFAAHWKRVSDQQVRVLIHFQLYFLTCVAILVLFELKGSPVLEYWYYASFLIPTAFLAIGAQLKPLTDQLPSVLFKILSCGVTAILILQYRFPPGTRLTTWVASHGWMLVFVLSLTALPVLFGKRSIAKTIALSSIACLGLGMINVVNDHFQTSNKGASEQGLLAMVQSVRAIQSVMPTRKPLLWYQVNEPMGGFYRSVASTYLWGFTIVNERFPALEPGQDSFHTPIPDATLVILSDNKNAFEQADIALRQMGLEAQSVAERRIQEGEIGWNMLFIEALSSTSTPRASGTGPSPSR